MYEIRERCFHKMVKYRVLGRYIYITWPIPRNLRNPKFQLGLNSWYSRTEHWYQYKLKFSWQWLFRFWYSGLWIPLFWRNVKTLLWPYKGSSSLSPFLFFQTVLAPSHGFEWPPFIAPIYTIPTSYCTILHPWKRRRCSSPKSWYQLTTLDSVTTQKTEPDIFSAS